MKSWHSHVDVGKKVLASAVSAAMVVAFTPVVAMGNIVDGDVAAIDNTSYSSLDAAVAAAGDNAVIKLLSNCSGNGVKVPSGKTIIFDLAGHTYNIDGTTVGSSGTETNGFQLLKDSNITFKNGKITSDKAKILIQNYSNLTLENVELDGTALVGSAPYTLSNNFGKINITGNTSITAKAGGYAFDVYYWPKNGYGDGVSVTVNTTGTITGIVEYGSDGTTDGKANISEKATLVINKGTFVGSISTNNLGSNGASISINGGTFSSPTAYKYAKSGSTVNVTLGEDYTTSQVVIPSGVTSTLDLNGKAITRNDDVIINNGTLTVKDSIGTGTISSTQRTGICAGNNSITTIKSGTIKSVEGAIITGIATGARITVESGTFSASDNAVIAGNGTNRSGDSNTIIINGGTFNGGITTSGYVACGIYAPWKDDITVNGGSFNITGGAGIVARAGNITVNGGSFSTSGNDTGKVGDSRVVVPCSALVFDSAANYPAMADSSKITVNGGTFKSDVAPISTVPSNEETAANRINLVCGGFSTEPTGFFPDTYAKHVVGTYTYVHTPASSTVVGSSSATCTTAGSTGSTVCSKCSYVFSSSSSIPALGHAWGSPVVTTPATETSEGVATSTCGRCGATQTSVLAKLPASGSDTTATDESGSKVDVTVTDNTPTTIPGTTTPAAGTVTYNGTEAAEGSVPATSVSIPSTVEIGGSTYVVTAIAKDAFKDETALTNVTIPSTVTTIGESAFAGCTSLTSVSVPAGVATIEANTFANCTSLETVEVKGELTEIAADAFNGCTNLTSMTVAGTVKPMAIGTLAASGSLVIPESVTKVGNRAFKGTGITSVTVPAGVKMGSSVFRDCKQLKSAVIEKGVKTLSSYTFKGCSALKSVTVPSGITKIERSVFSGCKNLTKVTLPKTVTSIGKNVLYGAAKAKTLTINSKKLTKSSVKGSLAGSKVTTVKVPKSMVSAYKKIFTKANCGKTVKVRAI